MTTWTRALSAAALMLLAVVALASPKLERFRYGDIEARLPAGWTSSVHYAPGARLLVSSEQPEKPETTSQLLWIEAIPLIRMDAKEFVEAFLAHAGVRYRVVKEEHSASTYEVLLSGRTATQPVKASVLSYTSGEKLYLCAFSALPEEFEALGGANLREKAFFNRAIADELMTSDSAASDRTKVWARKGGMALTEQMLTDMLAFGEFLAVHSFNADERNELRSQMIEEFKTNTKENYDTLLQIGQIVAALPKATPMRRAILRRDLMRDIYFELQKDDDDSPLMNAVYRHNPVLGADQERGLVVTKAGYLSLLSSNLFVLERAGLDPISAKQVDTSIEQLRDGYVKMSEKEKQYLAGGEINWIKLIVMWQSWDTNKRKQRMQWAGVFKIDTPNAVPKVARDLEHLAGFDMSSQQAQRILEIQLGVSTLEYMRMMIGSFSDF